MIRQATKKDIGAIAAIYNYYVNYSVITFEEEPVTVTEMQNRALQSADKYPWLVFEAEGEILGYAYAAPWLSRKAYRFMLEVNVYIHHMHTGKGVAKKLYKELFAILKQQGVHSVIGAVAEVNDAGVVLHSVFGFQKVAHFKETGFKFGKWIDVTYWQLVL
jgi:phosphinothricin acetyltransferase